MQIIRILLICIVFLIGFWKQEYIYGYTYIPAASISMTGSNSDLAFGVRSIIFDAGTDASAPFLDTTTKNLYGSFYLTGLGWGMLQTGTFQVSLNCGLQSLGNLTESCILNGSGWSETIGELGFSGITFDPSTGMLSGIIASFYGDLSANGIFLPLRPSLFGENFTGMTVDHDLDLSISGRTYFGDGVWELHIETHKNIYPRTFLSTNAGIFENIDLSLADTYTFTLTDPDGGTTTWDAQILPQGFSLALVPGDHFIKDFCTLYSTDCPDGATLSATNFSKNGDNLVGDGMEAYEFFFRPRDTYGNSINTGSVSLLYTATVNTNQLPIDGSTLSPGVYLPGIPGAAIQSDGGVLTNMLDGTLVGENIPLAGQDIEYTLKSFAPTNADNIIKLESITYHSPTGSTEELAGVDKTPLIFRPWFEASTSTDIAEIEVGEVHGFEVDVTNNSSRVDVTPDIFSFFSIGQNAFGAWRDFTSNKIISCQAYAQDLSLYTGLCGWDLISGYVTPSVVHVQSQNDFVLTGSYAPMSRYPIKEDVSSENVISYLGQDTFGLPSTIVYQATNSSYGSSTYRDSKLKILGVNNALGEYGDISLEGNAKTKLFDAIRKNIALLSRNRTTFDDVNYEVSQGAKTLTGGSFDKKRTLFVIGGDVTITENLLPKDQPVLLVSLSDTEGNGGVVTINPDVTDLDLTIITDRHVSTTGDKQLYIRGSLISSNTLGDTLAEICPYYVTVPCDSTEAAKYDLEKLREDYTLLADRTGKGALSTKALPYPSTAIILEYDNRIVINPPPGL